MAEIFQKYNYLSDPHSAVGYLAAKHYKVDGFYLSTAHSAKFDEVVSRAAGVRPELPEAMRRAMSKPRGYEIIDAKEAVLVDYLLKL